MTSKTFCILPWIHFYANADGSVLPCCIGNHNMPLGNVQQESVLEIWNNDRFKTLRKNMLEGKECNECSACYRSEAAGNQSDRQTKNKQFQKYNYLASATNEDGSLNDINLKYIDIRWSNICNFKCRSCSSTYSSSWATEDNNQGQNKKVFIFSGGESNDNLYNQILPYIHDLDEIYFAGGEPLLTDKHYDILEYLISINKTNVKLRYSTNLSNLKYKNKSIIDLWGKFSNVTVYVSLDSWGDRAEYIREGTVWSDIENNIKLVKHSLPHVNLQMSTVVSAFNLFTITEFLDYVFENKLFDVSSSFPSLYNLINPSYYSADILDESVKAVIIKQIKSKRYSKFIDSQLENVVNYLLSSKYDSELRQQFITANAHYDKIRDRNFIKTFPELGVLYL